MFIEVHTDNHIKGDEGLRDRVQTEVDGLLGRFEEQVTSVQVHLHDLNGHKHGIDKRCLMEARLAGHQPVTASHDATSLDEAISVAAERLEKAMEHTLGKLHHRKGSMPMGGEGFI